MSVTVKRESDASLHLMAYSAVKLAPNRSIAERSYRQQIKKKVLKYPIDKAIIKTEASLQSFGFVYWLIEGAIRNPGVYNYKTNMSLKDIILEAGGVNQTAYRYRVEIARIDHGESNENLIAQSEILFLNKDYSITSGGSHKNVEGGEESKFPLKPFDFITIKADPSYQMQKKVYINGAVNYPGSYSLFETIPMEALRKAPDP